MATSSSTSVVAPVGKPLPLFIIPKSVQLLSMAPKVATLAIIAFLATAQFDFVKKVSFMASLKLDIRASLFLSLFAFALIFWAPCSGRLKELETFADLINSYGKAPVSWESAHVFCKSKKLVDEFIAYIRKHNGLHYLERTVFFRDSEITLLEFACSNDGGKKAAVELIKAGARITSPTIAAINTSLFYDRKEEIFFHVAMFGDLSSLKPQDKLSVFIGLTKVDQKSSIVKTNLFGSSVEDTIEMVKGRMKEPMCGDTPLRLQRALKSLQSA